MIRYHKILSGLLTAALILGNYTAVSASDHAPEQHQTEESQDSAESASKAESVKGVGDRSAILSKIESEQGSEANSVKPSETEAEIGRAHV